MKKQLPTGQESFFKSVETTLQALEPEMQEQYRALGVLLEDMAAPLPILETLWKVDTADARSISSRLTDLSLAQSDEREESIHLHERQLDYVRAQFPDREALDLIHGAVRLSSHVINKEPEQFVPQLVVRLLSHQDLPVIAQFAEKIGNGTLKPWLSTLQATLDPAGTSPVRTLLGHINSVYRVAVSADGRRAVSASSDCSLKVWDVETGGLIATFTCDAADSCCALIADNHSIAGDVAGACISSDWNSQK